jgi:hypothetical protein
VSREQTNKRRTAACINVEKLCTQYLDDQRTINQLSSMHGFDYTTITKKLKEGLGADVYEKEKRRRSRAASTQHSTNKLIDPSLFHWLIVSRWGPGPDEEINQLARKLRDENDPLTDHVADIERRARR